MRRIGQFAFCLGVALGLAAPIVAQPSDDVQAARQLLWTGKYAEASEQFAKLTEKEPVAAVLGLARCQAAMGEVDKAEKTLRVALEKHSQAAALHAELALRLLQRGEHKAAGEAVALALKHDKNSLPAWWVRAELFRTSGKLKEAQAAYEWFVDHYNQHQDRLKDPDDFRWIGLAAAQHARWTRNSDQFTFLVSTLYPDALALEKSYWPAAYEAGLLFLEKYNQADATRKLNQALAINPNAAEVHAALAALALQNYKLEEARRLADRALEINPALALAHCLKADFYVANFQEDQALPALEAARKLNPLDEETLARIAALHVIRGGWPKDPAGTEVGKLLDEVNARNAHAGVFYFTLAEKLVGRQKFDAAEKFYREAIRRMPQLIGPQGQLGMMYMRLARETEAKKLLDESHNSDPFNVRVLNSLKVLDLLATYATIETEHFIIKFDRGQDELLARYAAKYLEEEVYPVLCKQFAFKPQGKTLFEIFNRAQNTSGHGWFSARMVGLPFLGTVGACAGRVVGMASPNGMDEPFNWARVLKHEFVHVLNLQQTNFNIPHWFTEALAVLNEETPRPEAWDRLLASRVPKGEVFNLDNINFGFIRPGSSDDWHMAYCQAELYAQYMLEKYGADSLAKMLTAYADNLNTAAALKRSLGVEQAEFEKGYLAYLKKTAAGICIGPAAKAEMEFAELQAAVDKDPKSPELRAKLAYAQLSRKQYAAARRLAEAVLADKPKHQLATYVLARVRLLIGENKEAQELLEGCLDSAAPNDKVLSLLAMLKQKAGDTAGVEKLYELGHKAHPDDSKWLKALASLYLKSGETDKLAGLLTKLADRDSDQLRYRKKLAEIALEKKDFAAVLKWANQANQINVMDAGVHRLLVAALESTGRVAEAVEEYETIVRLKPDDLEARLALAKACLKTKQPAKARAALEKLLELDADFPGAKELLKEVKGKM
jgi:tetratricopeptide (TPR) repeat protein